MALVEREVEALKQQHGAGASVTLQAERTTLVKAEVARMQSKAKSKQDK